jgi:1,4-alpha-glucan branching enzyme
VAFLRRMNHTVGTQAPGVATIAEESTAWPGVSQPPGEDLQSGGLGFHYKWNMGWMNDTLRYLAREPVHRQHHHDELRFGLMYAFSENFVLPLSHDEVVHGKRSLLARMPGDDWQRFAHLRLLLGWMWAHPGKKLLFMGGEFGQVREWNADAALDWHLLHDDPQAGRHAGVQRLMRDLNQVLRHFPALHAQDARPQGFAWVRHDDAAQSTFSFVRRAPDGRQVLVLANFTPVARPGFRVGVPGAAAGERWREVINTDLAVYGGSNVTTGLAELQPVASDGQAASLLCDLPPLAAVLWVRAE